MQEAFPKKVQKMQSSHDPGLLSRTARRKQKNFWAGNSWEDTNLDKQETNSHPWERKEQ